MEFNKVHKNTISKIENFLIDKNFYLAGGTGIYYYLNHRKSNDLDFFTEQEIDFLKEISFFKNYEISLIKKDTLYLIINNVKISLFYYPYPLIFPKNKIDNLDIANLIDIFLMKLLAIVQRGSKKDFIDIYFIIHELKIDKEEIYSLFKKKYGEFNKLILSKALVYFEDADKELMPKMIKKVKWEDIKKFFIKEFTNF